MEKYSDWRDKGTGIAPFLPPVTKKYSTFSIIIKSLILLVKITILLPLILLNIILQNAKINNLILKFLFGYNLTVTIKGVKRREINAKQHYPQLNRLYICNSTSPLDTMILDSLSQGPSAFIVPVHNIFYKMNSAEYRKFALSGSLDAKQFGHKIQHFIQLKGHVCYLFAEGTLSNGKSILPFEVNITTLLEFFELNVKNDSLPVLQTIHIKVGNSLTTPLPVSQYTYFWRLLENSASIKCIISEPQENSSLDKLRITLNDDDKYKLVSKSLDIDAKKRFIYEYKTHKD
ncbi:hypothetical protein TBLA_0C05320 [Henningerozyma blattae CBS 6284]|uniref:Phospholipid/glycerol acyltransferase domain-containing protein n=1 Tax=Henningerozyma blattae (strain ATCC 34711 / CBS 6284 / DSM 70876 / NBRC 10599 / NRRL Y-10934 / UCD 77-7) TaxID=1071380 RepID=I2H1S7_HENB6|nr:hypothetical protein TBLA_0C05320 [Tetrapisispora blattae CBS 6284]CCH60329.1 hypothetical protein TBLA_0C05320 [Tetrapisispora blattae CBS 6284]